MEKRGETQKNIIFQLLIFSGAISENSGNAQEFCRWNQPVMTVMKVNTRSIQNVKCHLENLENQ